MLGGESPFSLTYFFEKGWGLLNFSTYFLKKAFNFFHFFKNKYNLEELKTCLDKGEIHKCDECLVISLLRVDDPKSTVDISI